jgi:type IV pilus assembly protein PilB
MSQALVDLLVRERVLGEAQVAKLQDASAGTPEMFMPRCVSMGLIDDQKLLKYLSQRYGLKTIVLDEAAIPPEASVLFQVSALEKMQSIPVKKSDSTVTVAVADPTFIPVVTERIKVALQKETEVVLTSFRSLENYFKKLGANPVEKSRSVPKPPSVPTPPVSSAAPQPAVARKAAPQKRAIISTIPDSADAVVALNAIFSDAVRLGASDIHIEPTKNSIRVRIRVDGSMLDLKELPITLRESLIARTKVLAKLDSAERRIPQDGKLKAVFANRELDFRVNILPMIYGESMVLRIIKQDSMNLSFGNLGFSASQERIVRRGINAPYGMVLVTGPTGSGKTTTLYAALTELNDPAMKLATVEDPVEYNLEGIVQTQINKETGLGFAEVLRALLRQDPDVILVGEIRDPETAAMAVQAGLTGHVVLSTLHTNDAASAVLRLTNMGIEPILVASAVNVVISQRLLRKLCERCRYSSMITPTEIGAFGFSRDEYQNTPVYHAKGCTECNQTGYKGRVSVYEVLDLNDVLKEAVMKGSNSLALKRLAIENGMETLPMVALHRAISGLTSLEEALTCVL